MAESGLLARKFLIDKKSIKMEDCIMYIEQFKPDDKTWFYNLCTKEQEWKDKTGTVQTGLLPWVEIKKKFYDKYFPATGELSRRMKLFTGWEIKEDTAEAEKK